MKISRLALGLAAAALTLGTASAGLARDLTVAINAPILTLDPGFDGGSSGTAFNVQAFETLLSHDAATGELLPHLATEWSVAEDGVTWTFSLREGVTFHNGNPFTAQDVVATFSRLIDPNSGLARGRDLRMISEMEAIDDHTVKIVTQAPSGIFLRNLSLDSASILDAETIEQFGGDMTWNANGTGPYAYASHVAEESVTLSRFDGYWGDASEAETITFRSVPEANTRLLMLESGEVDIVAEVPGFEAERLDAIDGLAIQTAPVTFVMHVGMNTTAEPFDNPLVRRAINHAIDREAITLGLLRGLGTPATTIVAPNVFGFSDIDLYPYDPEKAKALLAEAGYPDGLTVKFWAPQGRYFMDREVAIAVQSQLAEVGITADVQIFDWATYVDVVTQPQDSTELTMYLLGWAATSGDIQFVLDRVFDANNLPPDGWNTMFYQSEEAEALRQQIASEVDVDTRREAAHKLQEVIMTDAPWAPLYSSMQVSAFKDDISGIETMLNGALKLTNVTIAE